jgi:phosphoglycerate kinase
MIITGGMAFTILNSIRGMKIGNSLYEKELDDYIREVINIANQKNVNLHLPDDFMISPFSAFKNYIEGSKEELNSCPKEIVDLNSGIPEGWLGLDIGPQSIANFERVIRESNSVALNGPSGLFEHHDFQNGTVRIMETISDMTRENENFVSVIGGGDSVNSIKYCSDNATFSHVSTGGGASLELLEGKVLPGIAILNDKE